ncbi:MAG: type II toxin-antitoxin system Phd/YefM family antitoxin [Thermodesulfobacteriota bacterium]|nr:type II toxin-antitoxin system Phd/YefM family antitoxin [Thermodesulfobacteriota bacterium]
MPTLTATDARRDFFEIIKKARHQHDIYHVQHRQGNVVLLSEEDYENMLETLQLLSIPGFRDELQASLREMKQGETVSFNEVFGQDE